MPKGFLIKRKKHMSSTWPRRGSESSERASDSDFDGTDSSARAPESTTSSLAANDCPSPVDLSQDRNDVFSKGLDLTMKKSPVEQPGSESNSTTETAQSSSENSRINNNAIAKGQQVTEEKRDPVVDNAKLFFPYREYNNNTRPPLAVFNRESYNAFLPSSLPSSAPLSIATSSWSPYYIAAYEHLKAVHTSPSSQGSSPRSVGHTFPLPPPPSVAPSTASSSSASPTAPPQATQAKEATNPKKRQNHSPATSKPAKVSKKGTKAQRKIEFDEDKSSPVSGTYIREEGDDGIRVVSGDIDTNLNLVEITPEAEAELAKIENKIGDYRCQLCKELFENAFGLAQHRCSRIVHVEYRCPECDKVFNCPANLASHRRWHKPRGQQAAGGKAGGQNQKVGSSQVSPSGDVIRSTSNSTEAKEENQFACKECGKLFKRQAYLRKHMATHTTNNNNNTDKPFPCHLCGKLLHNEEERGKHMLQHRMAAATAPSEILKHIPIHPSLVKDLMCRLCGSTFTDILSYDQHMRLHGSEAFSCKLCSMNFYNAADLSRHISKCHPSLERPPMVMLPIPAINRPC